MPCYEFTAALLIEADTEEDARYAFADASWDFAAKATCEEVTKTDSVGSLQDPGYQLYELVTEDAQSVALEKLGRKLTEDELQTIKRKIGDYIDWYESMEACIRDRVANE